MAGVSWSWEGLGGAPVAVGHGGGEFEGGVSMGRVLRYVRRYVNLCVCRRSSLHRTSNHKSKQGQARGRPDSAVSAGAGVVAGKGVYMCVCISKWMGEGELAAMLECMV